MPKQESTIQIADTLRTLGHPLRVRMVELLVDRKELAVKELCDLLDTEQSLMSHHLNHMKARRLLEARRQGKNIFYSMKMPKAKELMRLLRAMEPK